MLFISTRCAFLGHTSLKNFIGSVIFIEYVGGGWIYYTDCNKDGNGRYDAGQDAIVKREPVNGNFIKEYTCFIHP